MVLVEEEEAERIIKANEEIVKGFNKPKVEKKPKKIVKEDKE